MRIMLKSILELLICFIAAASLALIITTNLSVTLVHPFTVHGVTWGESIDDYYRLLTYFQWPPITHLDFNYLPISQSALNHFFVVRQFLLINEAVCLVSWIAVVISNIHVKKRNQLVALISLIDYLCIGLFIVSGLIAIDFDRAFISFHYLIFNDKSWLFNPQTDPIILGMPSSFFLKLFSIWLIITIVVLGCLRFYNRRKLFSGQFRF